MRLSTTHHLLGSTTVVLILAAPCLALAETGDAVRSSPDTAAANSNYGRAGGQAYISTAQPPQTPQALVNAYVTTKGYVAHAYEQTKGFLIDSAQGRASQELAAQNQQGEVDKPITSGASIGAYGREGVRTYWSNAQPTEPPRVVTDAYENAKSYVKHAYDKTKEFLTATPRQPTSEQPTLFNGA